MQNKKIYEEKAQAELDELYVKIHVLKAKKNVLEADTKIEYEKKIDELEELKKDTFVKFDEIKNSTSDAWKELKDGFEKSSKAMEKSIQSVFSRF